MNGKIQIWGVSNSRSCSFGVWGCGSGCDVCGCIIREGESKLTGDWGSDWESSVIDLTGRVAVSVLKQTKLKREWSAGRKKISKTKRTYKCFLPSLVKFAVAITSSAFGLG